MGWQRWLRVGAAGGSRGAGSSIVRDWGIGVRPTTSLGGTGGGVGVRPGGGLDGRRSTGGVAASTGIGVRVGNGLGGRRRAAISKKKVNGRYCAQRDTGRERGSKARL
jgi:hypothetical protein